jgi:hypothetical protein
MLSLEARVRKTTLPRSVMHPRMDMTVRIYDFFSFQPDIGTCIDEVNSIDLPDAASGDHCTTRTEGYSSYRTHARSNKNLGASFGSFIGLEPRGIL